MYLTRESGTHSIAESVEQACAGIRNNVGAEDLQTGLSIIANVLRMFSVFPATLL
jgi:hypothetical protein